MEKEITKLLENMPLTMENEFKHCNVVGWEYEKEDNEYFFNLMGEVADLNDEKINVSEDIFVQVHLQVDEKSNKIIYLDGFQHYDSIDSLGEGDYLKTLMEELIVRVKETLKDFIVIESMDKEMSQLVKTLEMRGYTYLIYNSESTWCSKGINPISATISSLDGCCYCGIHCQNPVVKDSLDFCSDSCADRYTPKDK